MKYRKPLNLAPLCRLKHLKELNQAGDVTFHIMVIRLEYNYLTGYHNNAPYKHTDIRLTDTNCESQTQGCNFDYAI